MQSCLPLVAIAEHNLYQPTQPSRLNHGLLSATIRPLEPPREDISARCRKASEASSRGPTEIRPVRFSPHRCGVIIICCLLKLNHLLTQTKRYQPTEHTERHRIRKVIMSIFVAISFP
jgi:hypothetical protein